MMMPLPALYFIRKEQAAISRPLAIYKEYATFSLGLSLLAANAQTVYTLAAGSSR